MPDRRDDGPRTIDLHGRLFPRALLDYLERHLSGNAERLLRLGAGAPA